MPCRRAPRYTAPMMSCADCGHALEDAGRRCGACARTVHAACWERAGGCGRFACPDARSYRRWLIGYLDKQLGADLAVVSWIPLWLIAALAAGHHEHALGPGSLATGAALLAGLAVPVVAVVMKRERLRGDIVSVQTIVEFARLRNARRTSVFARNRPVVARVEDAVTTPALFSTIAFSAYASWRAGSVTGVALAAACAYAAQALYLVPSRRALENPVRDFARFEQDALPLGAAVIAREDGTLQGLPVAAVEGP